MTTTEPLPPPLVELAVAAVVVVLLLWSTVDAALRPTAAYRETGHSKALWLLACVLVPTIGPLIYLGVIAPSLRRTTARAGAGG